MLKGGLSLEQQLALDLQHGCSKFEGNGVWTHGSIETASLEKALAAAAAYPVVSKSGLRLMKQAEASLQVSC